MATKKKSQTRTSPSPEDPQLPDPSPPQPSIVVEPPPEDSATTDDAPGVLRVDGGDGAPFEAELHWRDDDAPEPEDPAAGEHDEELPFPIGAGGVSEESVRDLLRVQGLMLNRAIGRAPEQWHWTDDELDVVAPALARVAARSSLLRRVAKASDSAVVAAGVTSYVLRNITTSPEQPEEEPRAEERAATDRVEPGPGTDGEAGDLPSVGPAAGGAA